MIKVSNDKIEITLPVKASDVIDALVTATLLHFKFNRANTAKALGMGVRTLQRRLKRPAFNKPQTTTTPVVSAT